MAETLGNLGQSLANNLNPLNTLRAYDIQQQVWLRNQQLIQAQRENAARQAAIAQWGHIVPADKLPQIQLMIYQGAPYDQVARAAAQLSGNLVDDPNAMQDNIRYIEKLTGKPYDYATNGPPVAGPNTAKQANDWKVNQAGKTAGATALGTKTGEQAAVAPLLSQLKDDTSPETTANNIRIMETINGKPWDNPYAPVVGPNTQQARNVSDAARAGQQASATSQGTKAGEKAANAPYFGGLVDDPSPAGTQTNIRMIEQITGQPYDASKGPPIAGPLTLKSNQDWQVANAGRTKGAEASGTAANTPINPAEPRIFPPPGGFVSTPPAAPAATSPAAAPAAAPPAAAAPAAAPPTVTRSNVPPGATPDPTRPGWYWQGGTLKAPVTTSGPAGTVIGYDPNDLKLAADTSGAAAKNLADAYAAGGDSATRLMAVTNQIRALEQVSRTGGLYGQITAASPLRAVLDKAGFGNITTAQQAQSAEDNLLKNTLPGMLKEFNVTRFASPEITMMNQVTGSSSLPPGVLDDILANVDATADYTIKRRGLAGQALGYDPSNPLNFPDYQQQDNALQGQYQPALDKRRQSYGAINTTPSPPVSATAQSANPFEAFWGGLSHVFGGGSQAASPAPQAQPNSVELDPNTGLPKAQ